MMYDSYRKTITSLDFTFERLMQFREEAQTEGIYKTTPDLADKATRIIERAENDFVRFDDQQYHGVKELHVWSSADPMLAKSLRTTAGGQQEILQLDQLRSETAELTHMLGDLRSLRGRVCSMIAQYRGWNAEMASKDRLKAGEAQTQDTVERDVLPALEALLKRVDRVIKDFELEERERLFEIRKVGNKIFIMRGGFTGRWARFNPALNNANNNPGGGAGGGGDGKDEGEGAQDGEPAHADGEAVAEQAREPQMASSFEDPVAATVGGEATPADGERDTLDTLDALDRGRMDERQRKASASPTEPKKKKKRTSTGKSKRETDKTSTDAGDS